MSTLADRTIAALRSNHDDLAARVRAFEPGDLDRQSGASEWDVAQVLSHLGSGAEIMLANLTGSIAGQGAPDQDFNVAVWDRWNAMSQQEKSDSWLESSERLVASLEGLDDAARSEVSVPLAFLPFPADIALFTGMRLNEAVLHAWDVAVALNSAAVLPTAEAEALIDQLTGPVSFLIGYLGRPDAMGGGSAAVRVTTIGPDRGFGLLIAESVSLGDQPADADATFSGPAESFLRLVAGRLGAGRTPEDVIVAGAVSLDDLRRVFPGL